MENKIFVELHVPDFKIAREFYQKIGFSVVSDDSISDGLGYFLMERNGTILNFYGGSKKVYDQAYFKQFSKETPKGFEVEIIIRFWQARLTSIF